MIAAREQLLDEQSAVLKLFAEKASAWSREVDQNGAVSIRISDERVLGQARDLAMQGDKAADALAAALKGS